ncbi:MAG: hypothetical protein COS95_04105 [Ignavibacteriales bacterium CG07_land_8_20_14_0_80_59_12]|nr:MAG: hypothetical protein COS95_04105 [Ignavibacteriales bacterium CG07_land_8_20_14_0_80_59_12]
MNADSGKSPAVWVTGASRGNRGHIFMISSVAARTWFRKNGGYSASKAGLSALASVLREEVREHGIKVTNVYPGATASGLWSDRVLERYSARMMHPNDVGCLLVSLYRQPDRALVEEVILRPVGGDL